MSPAVQSGADWFPFDSRVGFELADFIFAKAELSRTKTNHLLELWAATLVPHGVLPPVINHKDLLRRIDSIPLGDVPWECFSLSYHNPPPKTSRPPEWKTTEYDVWFRNPREVIKGILGNPEFDGHIDYSAYREFEDSQRQYCHMMSGDWAWKQSVRRIASRYVIIINSRTGHDFSGSFNTRRDVCADHPRIRQDNGFCCNRSERLLSPLPLDWQYTESYEKSAQERSRRYWFSPHPER